MFPRYRAKIGKPRRDASPATCSGETTQRLSSSAPVCVGIKWDCPTLSGCVSEIAGTLLFAGQSRITLRCSEESPGARRGCVKTDYPLPYQRPAMESAPPTPVSPLGRWKKGRPSLYGRRWRVLRLLFLARNPLCRVCLQQGILVPARVVDHIKLHHGHSDPLFWDQGNWQSLCIPCHDGVKRQLDRSGSSIGCDAMGYPLNDRWARSAMQKTRGARR